MSFDDDRGEPAGRPRRASGPTGQQALEELLQAAPGLARIAANMARQGASEIANAYVEGASRVVRAASQGESTADAVQETTAELRAYLRELIGVEESTRVTARGRLLGGGAAQSRRGAAAPLGRRQRRRRFPPRLHADPRRPGAGRGPHPALPGAGGRAAIGRRARRPAVRLRPRRPGLHDDRRGGRLPPRDRVHAYLNNLHRLGLVWFSREPLRDARRYQVLEAQTEVTDALERGGRTARTVRRSIVLTPFGEDFCAICLPLE